MERAEATPDGASNQPVGQRLVLVESSRFPVREWLSRMSAQDQLRLAIEQEQRRLANDVPSDREAAILALLRVQAHAPHADRPFPVPDVIAGNRLADPGGNLALRLWFESNGNEPGRTVDSPTGELDRWGSRFLDTCGRLAEAEVVLAQCESGFMRLVDDGAGTFDAWIATKRASGGWRERLDFDRWAAHLAGRHRAVLDSITSSRLGPAASAPSREATSLREADVRLETMANQIVYPSDAQIDGCTVQTYRDVLRLLIARALRAEDLGDLVSLSSERELSDTIASTLAVDHVQASRAVAAFTVDEANAGWHSAVPGVPAAPLVRIAPDLLALSHYGLTTGPLLFLTRELRRRAGPAYHDTAWLREDVFRRDLYGLFPDRRFVTSDRRIELRRDRGDVRTDVDAVVFDRKTGTLGVFELKSQDPFARSVAERTRQRDNVLFANRQISGVLDWLSRHGADDLLGRIDSRAAKRFRAHKVYPFVLGRYLAHFADGPEPDRRAAWGTWAQVLQLRNGRPDPFSAADPISSLHARLQDATPLTGLADAAPSRSLDLGAIRLVVHPSRAAFRER